MRNKVLCNNGTYSITTGAEAPCSSAGGVKQQNLKVGDVLTAEDKFYEKLGIKYHNTHMFGVASRMKGRFYLAVVLVAGYFAYKKFKK